MSEPSRDSFYVGYLPLPGAHRAVLIVLIPALFIALLGASAAIALSQRSPGDAMWDFATQREWVGVVNIDPYPMLYTDDGELLLVVGMGKHGVHDRVAAVDGARCRLSGWLLERDGRRMIELGADDSALEVLDARATQSDVMQSDPMRVSVGGEIVDGKCYLGAMKPGDGKGHKACAILCIQGGLPPMFAMRSDDGDHSMALLVVDGSTNLSRRTLDLVAENVLIEGTIRRIGEITVLETSADQIRRIRGGPVTTAVLE